MLSPADIRTAISTWKQFLHETGVDADFVLRSGETFRIKVVRKVRPDRDMTDGLVQQGFDVQFMYSDWHAQAPAGRGPEKGDQLTMAGRRHAIEYHKLHQIASSPVGYVCRVRG